MVENDFNKRNESQTQTFSLKESKNNVQVKLRQFKENISYMN